MGCQSIRGSGVYNINHLLKVACFHHQAKAAKWHCTLLWRRGCRLQIHAHVLSLCRHECVLLYECTNSIPLISYQRMPVAMVQDAAVTLASALLWASHPDALPLCQLARSALAVVDSCITSLPGAETPPAATSSARGGAPAAAQPPAGLENALQLLRGLTAALAEAGVLSVVAEAAVGSLGRAAVALSGLPAERQTAETAAAAAEAAAIVADLVTGFPTLLDQNSELLTSLSRCGVSS